MIKKVDWKCRSLGSLPSPAGQFAELAASAPKRSVDLYDSLSSDRHLSNKNNWTMHRRSLVNVSIAFDVARKRSRSSAAASFSSSASSCSIGADAAGDSFSNVDIAIVGGGIVGSTLACLLCAYDPGGKPLSPFA